MISSDAGRIVDDGTICRLDDETFYVTTTSSGAGAVEEWFSWWLADWRMSVAADRPDPGAVGGQPRRPARRARSSAEVTDLDCSNEAFKYLDGKHGQIAGVPCLILRIGFVGEVGYEIHFPAAHGEHVWDALLEAGQRARASARSASSPSGSCACRRCTSSSARTPTRSRRRSGRRCRGSSSSTRSRTSSASGRSSTTPSSRAATSLVGFTMANGDVPTEGAVVTRRRRHARRPGHERRATRRCSTG